MNGRIETKIGRVRRVSVLMNMKKQRIESYALRIHG
jgi:hypothetical protein